MTNPMGIRYPLKTRQVWVQISIREYEYVYEFLPVASMLMGGQLLYLTRI
jgi:hypothetical protein